MTLNNPLIGWGAAALAVILALAMPVNPRRVNQGLISILIVVLSLVAAFAWLEPLTALVAGLGAAAVAIVGRDVVRFVRHAVYDVTKYTRRDYWYRRIGQSLISGGRRSRRR